MIRRMATIFTLLFAIFVIYIATQGTFERGLTVRLLIMVILTIMLWIPLKHLYKFTPFKIFDGFLFRYDWFRRLVKATVGQKEYDEMESMFK